MRYIKITLLVFYCLLAWLLATSQGKGDILDNLPKESEILLDKLERYEDDVLRGAREEIDRKRQEVLIALTQHGKLSGQRGKSKEVVAIQIKIEELRAKMRLESDSKTPEKDKLPQWARHVWVQKTNSKEQWTFLPGGVGKKDDDGLVTEFTWSLVEEDVAKVTFPYNLFFLDFDRSSARVTTVNGGSHVTFLIRK